MWVPAWFNREEASAHEATPEAEAFSRMRLLGRLLLLWAALILVKLVYLQIGCHDTLRREARIGLPPTRCVAGSGSSSRAAPLQSQPAPALVCA